MKAIIREEEIICEPFDDWTRDHLDWLTTERPNGDGYKLIEDYSPPEIEPEISGDPSNI